MFRTPTGQTGVDAYVFEATAIANAQRVLDARFKELHATARKEHPELFKFSTDFMWSGAEAALHFSAYIQGKEKEFLANHR
jgi:hypothetical protein